MGDREDRLFPDFAEFFQKYNPLNIEMVRRLVEDEEVDLGDEELRDLHLGLLTSGE